MNDGRRIFQLFAELVDYPQSDQAGVARECASLIALQCPEAAAHLGKFAAFAEVTSLERVQEVFVGIFELNATCHPYIGYHLFGESYKRSVFLLGLKEQLDARGLSYGTELPDHLAVLLRFLSICDDDALAEELIRVAMLPALDKMSGARKEDDAPKSGEPDPQRSGFKAYQDVLQALRLTLRATYGEALVGADAPMADAIPMMSGD